MLSSLIAYVNLFYPNILFHTNTSSDELSKYKNILEFIPTNRGKITDLNIIIESNHLVKVIKDFCDKQRLNKFIVSLSGGVDSMVLTAILKFLGFRVICLHINYNNRDESPLEQQFLEEWCLKEDIILYTKVIDTIKRGTIKRSTYELESKNIRFGFYKEILEQEKCTMILLGHHKDDIIENVVANVCRGRNLLDLAVIKEQTTQNNITIARPMLEFYKITIYDFANEYQIPYFKDTTPEWSVRGKYRNKIAPLLEDAFSKSIKSNLLCLSQQSDEWNQMIFNHIIGPFMETVIFDENVCRFNTEKYLNNPMCFWNIIFQKIFYHYGKGYPSKKGILTFMRSIPSIGNASIANGCHCKIRTYKVIMTFTPE
jgi:tRNA(Ile)-lysidine synthetase-like protein